VSEPTVFSRTPRAWCLRILSSLDRRAAPGREASNLELLLTYFIQQDPSADDFNAALAQHVASTRPSVAEAAWLLQRSWLRGDWTLAAPTAPLLAETLRALGAHLDEAGAEAACLVVTAEGARLQAFGAEAQSLALAELWQEIAARTALRGQLGPDDRAAADRYETRLRAVASSWTASRPRRTACW
jgi:hypothetical protein